VKHPTFHVFKLKLFDEDKRRKDYHWRFDLIEHKLAMEVKFTLTTRQTKCSSQVERLPLKRNIMSKTNPLGPNLPKTMEKFKLERKHEL
jgi:hypothetical protein